MFFYRNGALQSAGIVTKNASEMENQVFQKSNTHEDYRNLIQKIVMHMQSKLNLSDFIIARHFLI